MPVTTISVCPNNCPVCGAGNFNFCGSDTIESEICFVPALLPTDIARVDVDVTQSNFHVELVCCNLIVVCGVITKRIFRPNPNPELPPILFKEKDIPVQIKVPANICNAAGLVVDGWTVTGVEVCAGCYALTCPDQSTPTRFHKLVEKDIIAVQVDRIVTP